MSCLQNIENTLIITNLTIELRKHQHVKFMICLKKKDIRNIEYEKLASLLIELRPIAYVYLKERPTEGSCVILGPRQGSLVTKSKIISRYWLCKYLHKIV